ncbi:MAG TPA: Na+/H+ antiporter subunit E [Solirubrobacterales bacterium]
MIQVLERGLFLAAIYLLVLTSLGPADVALALALGIGTSLLLRPRTARGRRVAVAGGDPVAALRIAGRTAVEMARGTWRTVRFCLGDASRSGFVEIPRDGRSRHNVAFWAVLTGEAPDEVVVDVDEERDVLVVHLTDARDPDAVRARHAADRELQTRVVP